MNTSAGHAQTRGVALAPVVAMSAKGNTHAPDGSGKSLCGDLLRGNLAKTKPAISAN